MTFSQTIRFSFLIGIALSAFGGFSASAQEFESKEVELDYRKAIEMALMQNFEIRIERYSPRAAAARLVSEQGRFDPSLRLSYTYSQRQQEQRTLNNELLAGAGGGVDADLYVRNTGGEFDSGIIGLAPWGLTYDLGASLSTTSDSRQDFTRYNPFVGLEITQPILRGFGTDVNLGLIRIARTNQAISDWQLRGKVIDIITETITAYNEYYYSLQNLKVERESRDLALQILEDNTRRAEIGVMSPLDITQARADAAAREERVLVAERQMYDNENRLKQLVSDQTMRVLNIRLRVAPPPNLKNFNFDKFEDISRALSLRPDYRQALLELNNRHINVVLRRNEALPRLDLVASFGINGIDTDLYGGVSNLSGMKNTSATVGAIFELPIPNRRARGRLDEAKVQVAQQLLDLQRIEQQIFVDIDNAGGQVTTTRKRMDATRVARVLAEETLAAAQGRLASGTSTTFEVLQFQRDLTAAQIAELRAIADHNIAIAEYARQSGTTLERVGLTLQSGGL